MPPDPPGALRGPARPLPPGFPRLAAFVTTYPANRPSLDRMLADFRRSDWGADPVIVEQPAAWPAGRGPAAANYKRALTQAAAAGCDFAAVLEDDVRVCRRLRHNLTAIPLVARDQCDYLGLYIPDLIQTPWERREPRLGYRLAKPLYSGPNDTWQKFRVWGSQGYLLSRRFILAALARWDGLTDCQDARVLTVCREHAIPLWYTDPCLVEHAPAVTAFGTPVAFAPDFDPACVIAPGPGFQPPEAVPGPLTGDEGELLYQAAAGRRVLELGTRSGRATVCLGQSAAAVVSVGSDSQAEAAEWARRFGLAGRVTFHRGDAAEVGRDLAGPFDLALIGTGPDAAGLTRGIAAALPVLAPGGRLAFSDYPDPARPAVRKTVDAHPGRLRWRRVAQDGHVAVSQT